MPCPVSSVLSEESKRAKRTSEGEVAVKFDLVGRNEVRISFQERKCHD